jgi:hypothetical protein
MIKSVLIYSLLLTTLAATTRSEPFLLYPHQVWSGSNCDGARIDRTINLQLINKPGDRIYGLYLENAAHDTIWCNGVPVGKNDTLPLLTETQIRVTFTQTDGKTAKLHFQTDLDLHRSCTISFPRTAIYIPQEHIASGEPYIVQLAGCYNDSLQIAFAGGGTETSVTALRNNTVYGQKHFKGFSPGIIRFHPKDTGTYQINYGSCHWGSRFELIIKGQ